MWAGLSLCLAVLLPRGGGGCCWNKEVNCFAMYAMYVGYKYCIRNIRYISGIVRLVKDLLSLPCFEPRKVSSFTPII